MIILVFNLHLQFTENIYSSCILYGTERTALAAEANHKFKTAQKMLDSLLKQAKSEGKATAKIIERLAQLKEMNENVVNTYLLGI